MSLYRAQSAKYLKGTSGVFRNPNLSRVRRPRDMPLDVNFVVSEWFLTEFGVDYRGRGLFCTGSKEAARGYASSTALLIELVPVGEFSLCYSGTCRDLFGHLQFGDLLHNSTLDEIKPELAKLGYVTHINCGLETAALSGAEVMLFAEAFRYKVIQ